MISATTMLILAAGGLFVLLHTLDGRTVDVALDHIVSVRETPPPGRQQTTNRVRCIVNLSDGSFLSVQEECADLRRRIDVLKAKP